jgi:hypothetical protein
MENGCVSGRGEATEIDRVAVGFDGAGCSGLIVEIPAVDGCACICVVVPCC